MARELRKAKPLIYIFCEGESEQAYAAFFKEHFSDAASFKSPASTGLFSFAESKFSKDARYRNSAEVTDEIWFFFDVEESDHDKWNDRLKTIKKLRRLRKKPNIRVRLLMTTACVESSSPETSSMRRAYTFPMVQTSGTAYRAWDTLTKKSSATA